jgi:hypothetical protein
MSTGSDGVLFECTSEDQSVCTLCVFDFEKGMKTQIGATVYEGGSFILNTHKILQLVRELPEGEITISVSPELSTTVTGGPFSYTIGALSGDNFPHLPLLSGVRNYTLAQHEFRDIVGRTVYAASQHDPKPQCNGVYFNIEGGKLTLVALDGFRLAINEIGAPDESADAKVLVPSKILLELMKLVRDSEDEITISLARKHVMFKIDDSVYFARLIDAEYVMGRREIVEENEGIRDCIGWCGADGPHKAFRVSFRQLLPKGVDHLLCAGRCLGKGDSIDTFRLIAPCFMTGHAAGVAAGVAALKGVAPRAVAYGDLAKALAEQNVCL